MMNPSPTTLSKLQDLASGNENNSIKDAKRVFGDHVHVLTMDIARRLVGKTVLTVRADWAKGLLDAYKKLSSSITTQTQTVGEISGFKVAFTGEKVAGNYQARLVLELPQAVELALEGAPRGRVGAEHVLNVIARLNAAPAPQNAATGLQVADKPLANTERYDSLRGQASTEEADHA